tara:strand:- start:313 stop:1275 length:963 start_codon:yes stop_codon:yes gene_type:complete
MFNIILIGAGYWGKNFIKLLNNMKSIYNFKGIVEKNMTIIKDISDAYPNIDVYEDYTHTFDFCDIYLIATPVSTHFQITKKCLENGKHVIVEKPLTDNYDKTKELLDIANKYNKRIFVNFTPIYTDPFNFIYNRYNNKLNEIYYIECQRCNLGLIRNDCNVIHDLTCHDIAMVIYFLNELPDISTINVSGKKCISDNIDLVSIDMFFSKNNILCHFYTSWIDNDKKRCFSIVSENEKLIYDDTKTINSITINKSKINKLSDNKYHYNFDDIHMPLQKYNEPIRNQLEHYYDCLTNNKKCKTDGEFALKVNEIIDVINNKL